MPQTRGGRRDSDRKRANSETTVEVGGGGAGAGAAAAAAAAARPSSPAAHENGGGGGGGALSGLNDIDDGCCCPTGCIVGEPIDPEDPDDSIPVICSNPDCVAGQYMHRVCFDTWEESVLTYVRASGRARNWSEKQMAQNLWSKKGFDVAYKACGCKCNHGHLRKDLDALLLRSTTLADDEARKRRNRRKSGGSKQQGPGPIGGNNGASFCGGVMPRARSRTLSVGSAAGICAPPSSESPPIQNQMMSTTPKKASSNLDFFLDVQVQNTGSIFQRRETMSSFYEVLPAWKVNEIHIKMEDDCPQGNDETRIFILTSLGDHKMRKVPCVLCYSEMTVYDKYPLIDGTFFMSPFNHGGLGVKVRHDARDGYLFALCIYCLERSDQYHCVRCGAKKWFVGDRLVLGTLYSYDVLAPVPCCPSVCKYCKHTIPMPSSHHHFSAYSETSVCPNCGSSDLHFIRQAEHMKRSEPVATA